MTDTTTIDRMPTVRVDVIHQPGKGAGMHAHQWSNTGQGNIAECGSCDEAVIVPAGTECIYCGRSVFADSPVTPEHLEEFDFAASEWPVSAFGGSWSEQEGDPDDFAAFWHLNCAEDIDAANGARMTAAYTGFTPVTLRFDDSEFTFPALQDHHAALFIAEDTLKDLQRHGMVDGGDEASDYAAPVLHPGEYAGLRDINGWEVNIVDAEDEPEYSEHVLPADLVDRIDQAISDADEAFWAKIAEHFPEAKSGDFGPEETYVWDSAKDTAVRRWLLNNVVGAR